MKMKRIAILASGNGSNAENLARYFENDPCISVRVLLYDRENAPVCAKMQPYGIETIYFPRQIWKDEPDKIIDTLQSRDIDLIVLAGFLSFVDSKIIHAYDRRIINLHPSLLPKFGGKGMWGMHVHQAVVDAEEKESGITVHYVSDQIDGGEIIAQFKCDVAADETPESLVISVVNPVEKEPVRRGLTFVSTKKDGANHDIGLKSIRSTAEKYRGEVLARCEQKRFTLLVRLNFQEESQKEQKTGAGAKKLTF